MKDYNPYDQKDEKNYNAMLQEEHDRSRGEEVKDYEYYRSRGMGKGPSSDFDEFAGYYIGESKRYKFMRKFKKYEDTGSKLGWNWCAFLFGCYWFIYRKMYTWGVLLLVFNMFTTYVLPKFLESFNLGLDLFVNILLGLFANYIYYLQVKKAVDSTSHIQDPLQRADTLRKMGGTSFTLLFVALIITSILSGGYYYTFGIR